MLGFGNSLTREPGERRHIFSPSHPFEGNAGVLALIKNMTVPNKFLLEGLDRLGKDTLVRGIQNRHGYHQVLHYGKPLQLDCYSLNQMLTPQRQYQEASFRTMFQLLRDAPHAGIICNRAHLGECVYAPLYRGYGGEYVFEIERNFDAHSLPRTRLVLLTEDFEVSAHFVDDGLSLGDKGKRLEEQALFLEAFETSTIKDKRRICVTDRVTGGFRDADTILNEALA